MKQKNINQCTISQIKNPFLNNHQDYLICENYKKIKVKQSFPFSYKKKSKPELRIFQQFDHMQKFRAPSKDTDYQFLLTNNPFNTKLNLKELIQQNKIDSLESCYQYNTNRFSSTNSNIAIDEVRQNYQIDRLKLYGLQCLRYDYTPTQNQRKNKNCQLIDKNTTKYIGGKQNSNRYPKIDQLEKNIFQKRKNKQQKKNSQKNYEKHRRNSQNSLKKNTSIRIKDSIIEPLQFQQNKILELLGKQYYYKQLKNKVRN